MLLLVALLALASAAGLTPEASATLLIPIPDSATRPTMIEAIPGSDQVLSLADALAEAGESNSALLAQRMRLDELRGRMMQARAIGLPRLDLSGNWSKSRDPSFALSDVFAGDGSGGEAPDPFDGIPPGDVSEADQALADYLGGLIGGFSFPSPSSIEAEAYWRTTLSAHWDFKPTLVYNAVGAAGLGLKHQEAVISNAEQRMRESIMATYYGVIRAGETLAALDADLAAKDEFLAIARRRFELGLATSLDTLRAAVARANLLPQRRGAAQALRDTGSRLNALMGRPALSPLRVNADLPIETAVIDSEAAVARVAGRPDVRQLELLEKILHKNRGAQKSEMLPYLSVDASYGYVAKDFDKLMDDGHDFWSGSLTLNIPLFDGLSTRGLVKETEASIRRTQYQKEDTARQARLEVLKALGDLATARENLHSAELTLRSAGDALAQTQKHYERGMAEHVSLLAAQSDRLMASSNLISARFELLTLSAALKRIMGFDPFRPLGDIADELNASVTGGATSD